ncbi:hypothetical protein AB837_00301 [bacterium AB1]|nr:hypothetical protein AB837_00301 [bacterium AB1]
MNSIANTNNNINLEQGLNIQTDYIKNDILLEKYYFIFLSVNPKLQTLLIKMETFLTKKHLDKLYKSIQIKITKYIKSNICHFFNIKSDYQFTKYMTNKENVFLKKEIQNLNNVEHLFLLNINKNYDELLDTLINLIDHMSFKSSIILILTSYYLIELKKNFNIYTATEISENLYDVIIAIEDISNTCKEVKKNINNNQEYLLDTKYILHIILNYNIINVINLDNTKILENTIIMYILSLQKLLINYQFDQIKNLKKEFHNNLHIMDNKKIICFNFLIE